MGVGHAGRLVVILLLGCISALPAGAQNAPAAPPRTIEDITLVLQQFKPDPGAAEAARRKAAAQPPEKEASPILAKFYFERSQAAGKIGLVGQQIADLRKAQEVGGAFSPFGVGIGVPFELGYAEALGGNDLNAMKIREQLVALLLSRDRPGARVLAFSDLAGTYASFGDMESARSTLKRADEAFGYARNQQHQGWFIHTWTARLERARAAVLMAEGKAEQAETTLRRALREIEADLKISPTRVKARGDSDMHEIIEKLREEYETALALVLLERGKIAEAEQMAREALRHTLLRVGRAAPDSGYALEILGRVIFEQARFAEAALLAAEAVKIYEQSGVAPESVILAKARRALGAALVAQGDWRGALAEFSRMKENVERDPQLAARFGVEDLSYGLALVRNGQPKEGAQMLRALLAKTQERLGDGDYRTAEVRGFLGIALVAGGDREAALDEFLKAMPVLLEQSRASRASESSGAARSLRLIQILETYIGLLSGARESPALKAAGIDPLSESFRIADVARGSHVQRALNASAARASFGDPKLAALARREQDAQKHVDTLTDLLTRLLSAAPEQRLDKIIGDIRRDIARLKAEHSQLRADIERQFADYANLVDPKPPGVAQVQAALREGEALVAYYVAASGIHVWAIPKSGAPAQAFSEVGEQEVARMIASARQALDFAEVSLEKFPKFDHALGHRLYELLLRPVEAGWKGASSLLVVPHRQIGHLPFGLLPTAAPQGPSAAASLLFEEYRKLPWLIRQAAVTQLPSVGTLTSLRRLPAASASRKNLAGFGDPLFSKQQASEAGATTQLAQARGVRMRNLQIAKVAAAPAAAAPGAPAAAAQAVNSSGLAQLARLPDTADEVREIARILGADAAADVFLGVRANERIVKTMNLADRKVVVFATHGLVPGDLNGLNQPALALSAPEVAGVEGDGLLTLEEILALKLDADWVVLSACNTASGEGAGSEALSGLGRGFFYAGTRALLVSNWPVETVSARLLTTELFRRQAENASLSRAEALRQTMLWLLDSQQADSGGNFAYAHPVFWAPFSLVGDGGGK